MRLIVVSLSVLALGAPALAQTSDEPPAPPVDAPPAGPVGERVVLPAKRLYARAALEIELSSGTAGDPVSLAPDVYYGVTPELTVGLLHSALARTGVMGGTGSSLCL